jgi:CRP-like cAMP-binding protein
MTLMPLDEEVVQRLMEIGTDCEFDAGQVMIHLGERGSGLFLITHGTVLVRAPEGESELGPGQVVGELSLLSPDGVRSAQVLAKTDVRALAVDRVTLEREGLIV